MDLCNQLHLSIQLASFWCLASRTYLNVMSSCIYGKLLSIFPFLTRLSLFQLKVGGNNLLNVCKLVFKVSRNEKNDSYFLEEDILSKGLFLGVKIEKVFFTFHEKKRCKKS